MVQFVPRKDLTVSGAEAMGNSFDDTARPKLTSSENLSSPDSVSSMDSGEGSAMRSPKLSLTKPKALAAHAKRDDDNAAKSKAEDLGVSDKYAMHNSRVHFSPDVKFSSGGRSTHHGSDTSGSCSRLSLSPTVNSTIRKVYSSSGNHGHAPTPGSGSEAQTLGSTPPSSLKTATMMTGTGPAALSSTDSLSISTQPTSRRASERTNSGMAPAMTRLTVLSPHGVDPIPASSQPSAKVASPNKSSAVTSKHAMLKPKSSPQNGKLPLTQSLLSSTTLSVSQESSKTNATASTSTSRRSKRQRAQILQDQVVKESKMPARKSAAGPVSRKIARKTTSLDPLDFDFEGDDDAGEENKPIGRNKVVAANGSKSAATSKAKASAVSKAKTKSSTSSSRNRR